MASLALTALNAWLTLRIELAIAKLRGEFVERAAKAEGQIEALKARE